jgi:hypothetical protein
MGTYTTILVYQGLFKKDFCTGYRVSNEIVLEKLFGESEYVPERGSESGQKGSIKATPRHLAFCGKCSPKDLCDSGLQCMVRSWESNVHWIYRLDIA